MDQPREGEVLGVERRPRISFAHASSTASFAASLVGKYSTKRTSPVLVSIVLEFLLYNLTERSQSITMMQLQVLRRYIFEDNNYDVVCPE